MDFVKHSSWCSSPRGQSKQEELEMSLENFSFLVSIFTNENEFH
jgi:hypothetical protein